MTVCITLTTESRTKMMNIFGERLSKAAKDTMKPYAGDAKLRTIIREFVPMFREQCFGFEGAKHSYAMRYSCIVECFRRVSKQHGIEITPKVFPYLFNIAYVEFGNGCEVFIKYKQPIDGVKRLCGGRYKKQCLVDYEELGMYYPWGLSSARTKK